MSPVGNLALIASSEPPAELSPARHALSNHNKRVAAARSELADAREPLDRLTAQLVERQDAARLAQAECDAIDRREIEWIKETAAQSKPPKLRSFDAERASALTAVSEAQRGVRLAEQALTETRPAVAHASHRHSDLEQQTDGHVLAVLLEEHAVLLASEREIGLKFAAAETATFSLQAFAAERGNALGAINGGPGIVWLRAAAAMAQQREGMPSMPAIARPDWLGFAQRLLSDPAAEIEA